MGRADGAGGPSRPRPSRSGASRSRCSSRHRRTCGRSGSSRRPRRQGLPRLRGRAVLLRRDRTPSVRALAHLLRETHGVGEGDRVAIAMRNYPEWVVGYWAILSLGAAVVGMNAWWTGSEMEYGLTDSRPKVLIADDERLERVLPHLDALRATAPSTSSRSVPTGRCPTTPPAGPTWSIPPRRPTRSPTPPSTPTTTRASSTRRAPPVSRRAHSSPTVGRVHNLMHIVFMTAVAGAADAKAAAESGADTAPATDAPAASPPVIMAPTPLFHVTANNCLLHPCDAGRRHAGAHLQVGPRPGPRVDRARGRHRRSRVCRP